MNKIITAFSTERKESVKFELTEDEIREQDVSLVYSAKRKDVREGFKSGILSGMGGRYPHRWTVELTEHPAFAINIGCMRFTGECAQTLREWAETVADVCPRCASKDRAVREIKKPAKSEVAVSPSLKSVFDFVNDPERVKNEMSAQIANTTPAPKLYPVTSAHRHLAPEGQMFVETGEVRKVKKGEWSLCDGKACQWEDREETHLDWPILRPHGVKPPSGFKLTGEWRGSVRGEWWISAINGSAIYHTFSESPTSNKRWIIVPRQNRPKTVPDGFELTGEYRAPRRGESFINRHDWKLSQVTYAWPTTPRWIVRRKPEEIEAVLSAPAPVKSAHLNPPARFYDPGYKKWFEHRGEVRATRLGEYFWDGREVIEAYITNRGGRPIMHEIAGTAAPNDRPWQDRAASAEARLQDMIQSRNLWKSLADQLQVEKQAERERADKAESLLLPWKNKAESETVRANKLVEALWLQGEEILELRKSVVSSESALADLKQTIREATK